LVVYTSDVILQDSEGYTSLEAYIIGQLSELKKQWEEHAEYIKQQTVVEEPSDKAADDKDSLKLQNTNPNGKSGDGFAIYPISTGESKDIATGNGVSKVIITYIPRDGESSADAKSGRFACRLIPYTQSIILYNIGLLLEWTFTCIMYNISILLDLPVNISDLVGNK
jgi:hypothetical protein